MRVFKADKARRTYQVEFTDHRNVTRRLSTYSKDKTNAGDLGRLIETLVEALRNGDRNPPTRLHAWLDSMREEVRDNLVRWGIIPSDWLTSRLALTALLQPEPLPRDPTAAAPLFADLLTAGGLKPPKPGRKKPSIDYPWLRDKDCLIAKWRQSILDAGSSETHARVTCLRAAVLFHHCGFKRWADITSGGAAAVARKLGEWRDAPRNLSHRTSNAFLQSAQQFCRWFKKTAAAAGIELTNPLDDQYLLPRLSEAQDKRRLRRHLTMKEGAALIAAAKKGSTIFNLTGEERAIVYQLALLTGLRYSEIRSLRRASFHLPAPDKDAASAALSGGFLILDAAHSKNGQEATLELDRNLAQQLTTYYEARPLAPLARALPMPHVSNASRMLREDLAAAKIPETDAAGRVLDFHSLRHTCGVWLCELNLAAKQVQLRMRLSSIALVDRYTQSFKLNASTWLDRLPNLSATQPAAEKTA